LHVRIGRGSALGCTFTTSEVSKTSEVFSGLAVRVEGQHSYRMTFERLCQRVLCLLTNEENRTVFHGHPSFRVPGHYFVPLRGVGKKAELGCQDVMIAVLATKH
jgi:hypothetical protein